MEKLLRKYTWRERVKLLEIYHLSQVLIHSCWSMRKTAERLNNSIGFVSEGLRLSLALRVDPDIEKIATREKALEFIRSKKMCEEYPSNEWSDEQMREILNTLRDEMAWCIVKPHIVFPEFE